MKKILIFFVVLLVGCTSAQISKTLSTVGSVLNSEELTEGDVAAGLKEALVNGVNKGSDQASQVDGFYKDPLLKIPFPPEIEKVETKLRQLGAGKLVDDFVLSLNRGAEKAAAEAKPIFVDAVKSMTVQDAWGILKGEDNAATEYLKRTTSTQLEAKFKPVIKESLDGVGATKHFSTVVNYYNKIPLIEDVNPNLDDYATQKAMEGLFLLIEKEEKNIREDPIARTTDLLKRVFAEQ
ncbi:MAG: DUF4197 domain-containing protein [Bacteroidota bacterium]